MIPGPRLENSDLNPGRIKMQIMNLEQAATCSQFLVYVTAASLFFAEADIYEP